MKEMILRVVKCGECFTVKSEKSGTGWQIRELLCGECLG